MSINWQRVVVNPSDSIKDVLKVIDKEALRVALVVDEQRLMAW